MICGKCGKEANSHKMSWFRTADLCEDCQSIESEHPVYAFAKEVERAEVIKGNMNFEGVLQGIPFLPFAEENVIARLKFGDSDESLYNAWDNLINCMSFKPAKFAMVLHSLNIDITNEAKSWISYMSKTDRVDYRNEAAHEACKKVSIDVPATKLTLLMAKNHRTLQQVYTSVMLTYYTGSEVTLPYI